MWMSALLLYFFTKSYTLLLCGMIFSMGRVDAFVYKRKYNNAYTFHVAGTDDESFNFTQGVGISGGQNAAAVFADGFRSWQIINLVMFGVGVAAFFLLLAVKIPDISTDKNIKPTTYMSIIKNPAFFLLILMCGFYYIPEHGLQNWLTTYASEHLGFTVSEGFVFYWTVLCIYDSRAIDFCSFGE